MDGRARCASLGRDGIYVPLGIGFRWDIVGNFFLWATAFLVFSAALFAGFVLAALAAREPAARVRAIVTMACALALAPISVGVGLALGMQSVKVEATEAVAALADQGWVGYLLSLIVPYIS